MSDARDTGRALDALAFGLGGKKKRKPPSSPPTDPYEVLTADSPGTGVKKRPAATTGLGGCSCTRRRAK